MSSPTSTSTTKWHWCWVTARGRVKRLGPAMECRKCRSFTKRHKCGCVPDYKEAWKTYPVEDCVACVRSGLEPAEGPSSTLVPQRKPAAKEPAVGKTPGSKTAAVERRLSRSELRTRRYRRKQLILLAVSHGVDTAQELMRVMERFGVAISRRNLYDDLTELTISNWLVREKTERDKSPQFQRDWSWSYTINPALLERMSTDEEANTETD